MYSTSWELPELVSGTCTMVSDADGKHYPWYGANNEVTKVRGPTHLPTPVTVSMRDTFRPQVWRLLLLTTLVVQVEHSVHCVCVCLDNSF